MTSSTNDNDLNLFSRIASGDEGAFRTLFSKYTPVIHPFVLSIVKQDAIAREIVQEVFLRIWLKRETLTPIEKPSSWIYRVASNLALNQLKRSQTEARILDEIAKNKHQHFNGSRPGSDDTSSGASGSLTAELDGRELKTLIDKAIETLPPQRRKVFSLVREQGLSRREAAEKLNLSENTIKSQLAEALRTIQAFIEESTGSYIPIILLLHYLPH